MTNKRRLVCKCGKYALEYFKSEGAEFQTACPNCNRIYALSGKDWGWVST